MRIKRGDIVLVDFEPIRGSEQGGIWPALVIQNNVSNEHSPVIIVAAITSKLFSKEYPTNVFVSRKDSKLDKDSTILLNQIKTIDKKRIIRKIGSLDSLLMSQIDLAIKVSLGLV